MTNYKYKGDFEYCKLQMCTFRIHIFSSTKGQYVTKLWITNGAIADYKEHIEYYK